ncbi:MAG: SDR family NAD(P)-dependent oxidoreductase, partial [Deinococcus sp.]
MKKRLVIATALGLLAARRLLVSPYDLRGKVVLITGGSRGLGLALAREFASRGARLALLARDPEELGVAGAELRARGAEVRELVADLARPQEAERAVAELLDYYGGLDVLVNSVGIIQASPLANLTLDDYHGAMDINFYGPLHAMLAARPALARSGGRILNVASVGGKVGVPHLASYSASKFALVGLGQAWRAELRREGVTLTTVCPGLMRTGSPRNAMFKGQHRDEYAWFSIADSLPLTSMSADRAARRILRA